MKRFLFLFAAAALVCPLVLVLFAGCAGEGERTLYTIDAAYEEGVLTAEMTVSYYNDTGGSRGELWFNLYGNAYREGAAYAPVSASFSASAYYAGASCGGMEIRSVSPCTGWEVGGADENVLRVSLSSPVPAGGRCELTVAYTLTLAEVNHRTGVTENTVNLGNFYPVACARTDDGGFFECVYYSDGDPFVTDCADYMVEITLPEGYSAATSGKEQSASGNTHTYTLNNARDFCLVLSDEFSTLSQTVDGTKVTYYYYSDESAQKKLDAACESLAYFNDAFGQYYYPTLSVVQTGFAAGGMEYPALTMINDGLSEADSVYAIVHENAHQWWYAMVGSDQVNCAWQDEGLAEYSTLLFFENNTQYGFTRTGLISTATSEYRAFFTVYNQIFGDADTTMTRHLKDFVSDYEYVNIAYNKGLILFDTLRTSIGDERFLAALKSYFSDYSGKIATPDDLIKCFYDTGVDINGFFESFIEGKIII